MTLSSCQERSSIKPTVYILNF